MRPPFHPSVDDVTVECILHALSDPVRVAIFAKIASADCPKICSEFVKVADHPIPKSTLSQHFRILREAGLIRSERRGVELLNSTRCAELERRFPGLTTAIVNAHAAQCSSKRKAPRNAASSSKSSAK